MKMIWLGSVLTSFGLALSAHAVEPVCVDKVFSCPFKNEKGQKVFLQVHASHNTYAELVMTSPNNEEPSEPKPATCRLDGDTITVKAKVEVTQTGATSRTLPTKREEEVTALQLKWIKGKDSKSWIMLAESRPGQRRAKPVICTEAM